MICAIHVYMFTCSQSARAREGEGSAPGYHHSFIIQKKKKSPQRLLHGTRGGGGRGAEKGTQRARGRWARIWGEGGIHIRTHGSQTSTKSGDYTVVGSR